MQFRSIRSLSKADVPAPAAVPPVKAPVPQDVEPTATGQAAATPATGKQQLVEASQNLLKHIPGEASGFYLMAVDAFDRPSVGTLGLLFFLALVLLIAVRVAAGASRGIIITTVLAFLLWMLTLDKGFLNVAFSDLIPEPLGLILVVFYSTFVTILASAGKIK